MLLAMVEIAWRKILEPNRPDGKLEETLAWGDKDLRRVKITKIQ